MLQELEGGRDEVQRRGKVHLTPLVALQLSDAGLLSGEERRNVFRVLAGKGKALKRITSL